MCNHGYLVTMVQKTKNTKKIVGISIAVLLFGGAVVWFFTGSGSASAYVPPQPAVIVAKPVRGTIADSITISGYVEAKAMIPVVPFVQGTITEYTVQAGDYVEKDQILARIDDAAYRQQFLQAEAGYWGYQSTFERIENLYKSGAATQQNYDSTKAQRDAAKAQYDLAKLQLDYTEVKASISGTVLIADQAVGSIGTQTTPVAVIADLDNQVVRLKVPEKYFDLFMMEKDHIRVSVVRPGQPGMYDDAETSATIETIAPYVNAESKNFMVVCRLDDPGERFRPGMYVKVTATYRSYDNQPLLPLTARKLDGGCYSYNPATQTVTYHQFENVVTDNDNFAVPGEFGDSLFVVDGVNTILDGQVVTARE